MGFYFHDNKHFPILRLYNQNQFTMGNIKKFRTNLIRIHLVHNYNQYHLINGINHSFKEYRKSKIPTTVRKRVI
ncbi:hypothetical protein bcgnr5378_36960 [Bacillus cereus]